MGSELAVRDRQQTGIVITDLDGLLRFAGMVVKARLAPKGLDTPEAVALAVQYGLEIGLTPMQAVQSIMVTNGRPSIYGDAMLAVVRASGLLESIEERVEGEGDARAATCIVKRVGCRPRVPTRFSVSDAKRAGLWGKQGPWTQYSDRMLTFRARSWALRDEFGDVLKGLVAWEEAQDIPHDPPPVTAQQARRILDAAGIPPHVPAPTTVAEMPIPTKIDLAEREPGELRDLPVETPRITDEQINTIRALLGLKGKTDADLARVMRHEFGKVALDDLETEEAERIIERLGRLPNAATPPADRPAAKPAGPALYDPDGGEGRGDAWEPPVPSAIAEKR